MPRRPPNPGTQQVAPKGLPRDGARGRKDPLLPRLPPPQLRGFPGGLRASEGGGAWWPGGSSHPELGLGVRSPSPRLPALPTLAQNPTRLRSLLLPPLLLAGAPREPAPRRTGPGEREDSCRGAATLRALLAPSASQPKRSVSEHCHHSLRCPHDSFLPDLRGQSWYFQNSLKKILLHQIPALGTLRRDHSQFTLRKANHRPHGAQAPKLKAVLTHSSSGEGSGQCRRFCPFRVRFADETLRDTALRYWERSCAVRQGTIENGIAPRSMTSEGVFGSVGR
ncbi:uncharacterized protein C9orf50 homolog isoform X5 [Zalophus californianus]|uniref:Uncharacterized protein C9orf50 homolog isoform X5 n=1 Tax=Zalophus californianus TaxID=9704 RepID=A0A6P9F147_ZALCA|nr:uncharacterized protein C9orf50 homolog isoform X5 [Zalophus californianus]